MISVLVVFWVIGVTGDNSEEGDTSTTSATQQTIEETTQETIEEATEEPEVQIDITTQEGLKTALTAQLGAEPATFDFLGGNHFYISFEIQDNFTQNLMRTGAWSEVRDIIETVQRSGLGENLTVYGTLELMDENGNSIGQQNVLTVNILDGKLTLLNMEVLRSQDQLERAATSFFYHPAFQP